MMQRLTIQELNDKYGGRLPPGATLRPDDGEASNTAATVATTTPEAIPKPPSLSRPGGRAERFGMLNAFVDVTIKGLTRAEIAVWFILFRDTKAKTGTARTSQADLGRRAGLNPRTVRRALTSLERRGLLTVVRRGRLAAGPSTYRLHSTGPHEGTHAL